MVNQSKSTDRVAILSGAVFLFGLGGLVMAHAVWPWILLLILIVSIPILLTESGLWLGSWIIAQSVVWLVGLPLLIAAGIVWPGVLFLAGISSVLVALAPPDQLQEREADWRRSPGKRKRKREFPLPPAEAPYTEEDDDAFDYWEEDRKHHASR